MENLNWQEGVEAGKAAYSRIMGRGRKWQARRIPIYIRENLLVPYYITYEGEFLLLHVVKYPEQESEKVSYEVAVRLKINETAALLSLQQSSGQNE
ncbi:hypothetical protein [Salmonirosea aquatica]|uniref:Uncharacterized protein n=1 Tax=Salmonirosea aquatica TaxID=2654236 RepID=A0A7C9FQ95_9BACT|nr:hypothetical protein [Cytophagaceae bacterium SJW1-29]